MPKPVKNNFWVKKPLEYLSSGKNVKQSALCKASIAVLLTLASRHQSNPALPSKAKLLNGYKEKAGLLPESAPIKKLRFSSPKNAHFHWFAVTQSHQ